MLRHEALSAIMGLVEAAGTSFAFPPQAIHAAGGGAASSAAIGG